jgi:hypothetical protein
MSTDARPSAADRFAPDRFALDGDGWRQALRIAGGSVAGLAVAKLSDWPFGVFFAVYPVLLLGLSPAFNARLATQFIASSPASIAMASVLVPLGEVSPALAVLAFLAFAAGCFRCMARGPWFLFGALSLVSTSVLAHLGSYPNAPVGDLHGAQFLATCLSAFIAGTAHALLPERRAMPARAAPKPATLLRHQVLLGAVCATASFVAFQVLDLRDSLSAQAATVLVLFPMTLAGGRAAAWTRVAGTLAGSAYALALQLLLYTHASHLLLVLSLYGCGMLLFATWHVRERAGPAVGFSAATAIAVMVGQLSPGMDLFRVSLYRSSSVTVAVLAMLACMHVVHAVLDRFEATRAQAPGAVRAG